MAAIRILSRWLSEIKTRCVTDWSRWCNTSMAPFSSSWFSYLLAVGKLTQRCITATKWTGVTTLRLITHYVAWLWFSAGEYAMSSAIPSGKTSYKHLESVQEVFLMLQTKTETQHSQKGIAKTWEWSTRWHTRHASTVFVLLLSLPGGGDTISSLRA